MRKVCKLGREVLDIAAAAIKPGVTTDYIDKIVHEACLERNVSVANTENDGYCSDCLVLPLSSQLCQFPEICLYITKRSHLSWHS